jgi:hypothetical protein
MNKITGKITLTSSNTGISNLLVVIYDIDPNTKPEELIKGLPVLEDENPEAENIERRASTRPTFTPPKSLLGILGDRIGSVLTETDGSFSLEYEDAEYQIRNPKEKRPDLFLMVFAPEKMGGSLEESLLFYSPEIRQNAGRIEMYFIQLTEEELTKVGIGIPQNQPSSNAKSRFETYKAKVEDEITFTDDIAKFEREKTIVKQKEIASMRDNIKEQLIIKEVQPSDYSTFVAEGKKVIDVWKGHFTKEVDSTNNKINAQKGLPVTFFLNAKEKGVLNVDVTKDENIALTKEQLDSIRAKMNSAGTDNLILTSNNPILKKCLKKNDDVVCAVDYTSDNPAPTPDPVNPPSPPPAPDEITSPEDITKYINKVLNEIRLKNNPNVVNLKRPDQTSVDDSVNKFNLKKGPAELPSFYDFTVLQIAFGHVWKQLFDETVLDKAAEAVTVAKANGYQRGNFVAYPLVHDIVLNGHYDNESNGQKLKVVSFFDITDEEWNAIKTAGLHIRLVSICDNLEQAEAGSISTIKVSTYEAETYSQKLREQGEQLIDYVRHNNIRSYHKIIKELDEALKSKYMFTIFGADKSALAVNFGLVNTYRQKWEPIAYQVGNLVKSIPLSAKEERKYSLKTTFTKKRSDKEAQKNNMSKVEEQNTTSRAEAEIVAKAQSKTDFNVNGSITKPSWSITSSFGMEAQKESQQNRKDFRESVLKATQEYKEERSVEITTEDSYSSEYTESGTITNPNDELAVTYLFYELQKRFKVSEQLYRVMPVVMVAQEVPSPHQITEAWIISNDWIINRVLLDDSFRTALHYIAQKNVGEDFAVRELRKNLRAQRQLVETLKKELTMLRRDIDNRYAALESAIKGRIAQEKDRETDSFLDNAGEALGGFGLLGGLGGGIVGSALGLGGYFNASKESPEAAKAVELAARDAHQVATEKSEKLAAALQRETNSLHQLTTDYNKSMRELLDQKTMVARLKTHIKNNIIYYMQAIWTMEPPDQRFMRLINTQVPHLEFEDITCELMQKPEEEDLFAVFRKDGETMHKAWIKAKLKTIPVPVVPPPPPLALPPTTLATKDLVEVADLDKFLGFKGNYMVFPLKQHNALTELMAMPYVDSAFGAMDPDQLSNISLEEYARYVCCLKDEMTEVEFNKIKPTLKKWLEELLKDPLRNGDEIIVPTNSLYIEVMTSANTILEDFKLQHREWDVYKVQEEVRMQALENLRYAKRILMDELEDPRIEKKIVIEGGSNAIINPDA